MANPSQTRSLSLDTNIILALGAGEDYAHSFREVVQSRGFSLFVPPTAIEESTYLSIKGVPMKVKNNARDGLRGLGQWKIRGVLPTNIDRDVAEAFAQRLIHANLLPDDEFNDGCIAAETALAEIPWLVTSDNHLLSIAPDKLTGALAAADLNPVTVINPRRFLALMRRA